MDYATLIEAQRIVRNQPTLAKEIARQIRGRPMSTGMTKRQRELLMFIRDYVGKHGIPPSFDEMKAALGLASKSGIHRLISALDERGQIERRNRAEVRQHHKRHCGLGSLHTGTSGDRLSNCLCREDASAQKWAGR